MTRHPPSHARRKWRGLLSAGVILVSILSHYAAAGELVTNGSFEINNGVAKSGFTGWNTYVQTGSNADGGFLAQSGTKAPLTPFSTPVPPEGTFAAMTDQNGPGSYLLYQDVALPAGSHPMLTARIYVQNEAADFHAPASLDYTTVPNQQARFELVNPSATVTDVGAGVLQTFYASQAGDTPMSGYTTISADLSAYAGSMVRLRFAEVDNLEGLLFGVDAVSIHQASDVATSTALTGTTNPSVYGQPVALTATVTGQAPTGSVTFFDAGIAIACGTTNLSAVDATHAAATCTSAALQAGAHNITAIYNGDATNLTSTAPVYVQVVNPAATTTTIVPPIAVMPGQPAQISVNVVVVAPGSATLSGMVTIVDSTDSLSCSYSLPAPGCSITPGSSGIKMLTATFVPDAMIAANVSGSTGTGQLVATTATVTVTVISSLTPSSYGSSVTFTATVTGQAPTGSVSFVSDGVTTLCSAASLAGGGNSPTATCMTNALSVGTHTIQATYGGDTNNVTATATVTQDVIKANSVVTLTSSTNSAILGSEITFTATVGGTSPTGNIVFSDGATVLGTVTLSGGSATLSASFLTVGLHTITAAYSGDANYTAGSATLAIGIIAVVSLPATDIWALLLLALGLTIIAGKGLGFGFRSIRPARE